MTLRSWSVARKNRFLDRQRKGSLLVPLFLFAVSAWSAPPIAQSIGERALRSKLHEHPTWRALTHMDGRKTRLRDSPLILTGNSFTLATELIRTIEVLYGSEGPTTEQCRLPARNEWISAELGIEPAPLAHCADLNEFLARAPVDRVAMIYASENISQPSSTMGHILIKIEGEDSEGNHREYAVSFFTEIKGFNVPRIVYDSLIAGKKGYFSLTPYEEKAQAYRAGEQRNIWEYYLELTEQQRRMVQLHIWELKTANPTYLFDSYNCATLTNFIFATANPALLEEGTYFMSPLDVVKGVNRQGMISKAVVIPSSKWKVRMISESLPTGVNRAVQSSVESRDVSKLPSMLSNEQQFLVRSLAHAHNDFLYEQDRRPLAAWTAYSERLDETTSSHEGDYLIDLSQYKNPLKTPRDGQWYGGYYRYDHEDYLKVGLLAVSHTLSDDNRQFFSETELRLADLSILVSAENGDIELNEFQLLAASSFLPRNRLIGGLSGRFRLGLEPHYDESLRRKFAGNVGGALGATYEPIKHVLAYGIINLGLGYRVGHSPYPYAGPEVGIIVDETFDMKTIVAISTTFGQVNSGSKYSSVSLRQSKRIGPRYTMLIEGNYVFSHNEADLELGATLKYLF